jgi:hypothetical protein
MLVRGRRLPGPDLLLIRKKQQWDASHVVRAMRLLYEVDFEQFDSA